MQNRNVLNSPRLLELKKHRRRAFFNKILMAMFGLLAVFSLLAYLSRLNSLRISQIEVVGNKVADAEAIKSVAEEQMAGNYFWFFPRANFLLYPQNIIKAELGNNFKIIKDINLSIKNKILEISITERQAKYIWCGATVSDSKCNFIDEDGYIFDEAPYFSGEVYFKFYGAQTESYFYKQNFKQLILFRDNLIKLGLKPFALYVKDGEDAEMFLSNPTSTTVPKIIFKIGSDLQNVTENLQAALTTEPLQSKFKNDYASLQYIDLRFGNKVYDKFK